MRPGPLVGITMGDPAGVGPEIIVKALADTSLYDCCVPICIADPLIMQQALTTTQLRLKLRRLRDVSEARGEPGTIEVLPVAGVDLSALQKGRVSAAAGDAAYRTIREAIDLALAGRIGAVATAPIHKEALRNAGHQFAGHTEIFAHFTQAARCAMMLIDGPLRVAHVSTHVSLRQACDAVTTQRVFDVIELAHEACQRFGVTSPRLGVAGLNPHASDGGLFGHEEQQVIAPAIARARQADICVEGPFSPDTFFARALEADCFDACVAMYHDQGHIPVKMVGFRHGPVAGNDRTVTGVNISLGLPIVRTSVDHGTAFDLAGTGQASAQSMIDAIRLTARLAPRAASPART